MNNFDIKSAKWLNAPNKYEIHDDMVKIQTNPKTDFWQRTYYGFQNDNAHVFYNTTGEKYFSLTVKVEFDSKVLFDQCGLAIYQDSDNWAKAAVEYHDEHNAWLGSVVTNNGYSDWATTDIGSSFCQMWYRLSRRESGFCFENSFDGMKFKQMRIFHLFQGAEEVNIGLLACSPGDGSFTAIFSEIRLTECFWKSHQ
jgi:hypothetical protein